MTINSTTRKTNPFVGNGSAHTFPFTFKVFTDADIVVKKLEASTSIETTLTLGLNNDYIVTLNADQNSNPGGSITLKSGGNNQNLASGFSLVITSDVDALQGVDLTNQGGFFPEVINDALDKAIIIHQQQQTELDRSIRFSLTNTIGSLEITENANARANKVLGFDNLGEFNVVQELGTYRGNWTAGRAYVVRDLVKDTNTNNIFFCNTAHTSSGNVPLTTNTDSAKWDLIVDAATATTSSTNAASSATAAANSATAAANSATAAASSQTAAASSATTASTKATQADTAKTAAQTAQTAAETAKTAAETALDSFDDRYLGAKSSNPTLDNDGNALIDGALYFNTTVNRMRVYDLGNTTWLEVTISGSDLTNTNTVAGAISNVNAVGGNISNVNAVASNATNINAVNSNSSNINTVAGAASNINTVSGSIANVNTVGGGIANVNTVAAEINNNKLQTVANNINAVVTAANDLNEATSEIDTVANNIANVNNVGNSISNVNTVAGAISNVNAVASNASNVNTVAGAITNVNNVGGSIANVNTVANNLSGVNSFAERYRTDNTGNNPSTSLNAGDLFYNQASGKLLVYNGQTSAWEETQSVGNFFINTISSFSGTGGNSATFNGSAYKFTLSNAGQFAQQMLVSINGVVQKPNTGTGQPSEGFALDGANIVFSSPPPSGADFFIVTIGASVSIGTPSDGTVTEAKLNVSNNPVNGYFLQAQSGAAGGLTWAQVSTDLVADTTPQLGGNLDCNDKNILLNDSSGSANNRIRLGASQDFALFHNGTSNIIEAVNGDLNIRMNNSENAIVARQNAGVELYHNNVKKFDLLSQGARIFGYLSMQGSGGHIYLPDSAELKLGNSEDLRIYHNGSNSFIQDQGTGNLFIDFGTSINLRKYEGGGVAMETVLKGTVDGSVELYHNGNRQVFTIDGGMNWQDNKKAEFGNSGDLKIYHDGSDSIIKGSGTGSLILESAVTNEHLQAKAGVNGDFRAYVNNGTLALICNAASQNTELRCGGTKRFETTSTGFEGFGTQFKFSDTSSIDVIINADTDNNNESHTPRLVFQQDGSVNCLAVGVEGNAGTRFTSSSQNSPYIEALDGHGGLGIEFATNNNRRMRINHGGTIDGDFNDTSDGNLKENIVSISSTIDKVKALRPVTFDWKDKTKEKNYSGFIAQEVKEIYPNLVTGEEHTVEEPWKNYSLNTTGLVAYLTKALQESIAKIETLETKVAALEGS